MTVIFTVSVSYFLCLKVLSNVKFEAQCQRESTDEQTLTQIQHILYIDIKR